MKAVVYRRRGDPSDVLNYEEVAAPANPGPTDVTVRVTTRMVHPIDGLFVRGLVPGPPIPLVGTVPGVDGIGIVEHVGVGVDPATGIVSGQRVGLLGVHGTWAERVVAPARAIIPVPDDVSDTTGCQILVNGITAVILRAALAADSRAGVATPLLVTAAGSGVGRNLIALAQMRGVRVVATVRSDAGAAILRQSVPGLPVVSTEHETWPAAVTEACGDAPSVAIDPIGGDMNAKVLNLLARGGTLLTDGGLDSRPTMISTIAMTVRQLTVKGANTAWSTSTSPEQRALDITVLFDMTRRARQHFAGYRAFPITAAVEALSAAQATPRRGATILTSGS